MPSTACNLSCPDCLTAATALRSLWPGGMDGLGYQVSDRIRSQTPGVRGGVHGVVVDACTRTQKEQDARVQARLQGRRDDKGPGGSTKPRAWDSCDAGIMGSWYGGERRRRTAAGTAAGGLLAETMVDRNGAKPGPPGPVDTPDDPYPVPRRLARYTMHRTASRTLAHGHTALHCIHCNTITHSHHSSLTSHHCHHRPAVPLLHSSLHTDHPTAAAHPPAPDRPLHSSRRVLHHRSTPTSPVHLRLGELPSVARPSRHPHLLRLFLPEPHLAIALSYTFGLSSPARQPHICLLT